ncbi:hypothetical protein A3E15_00455 [Candidatus Woesebacteria bacterium RIFCSPHIGHO2_12_FULL_42_9]|uniref:Uncharacterized protein n=2 Tax=Candidatus Woeseibacteriota TaxID=1752722 RepID=A0A1F8AUR2_9BACT|nr:MAG: hypothetical protein A2129_00005 [Candidatus Woesebacteria bacterium GWC1_42_13]OGM54965.1 MAG: hypothetical protein A3E15_00455 [Candidatus Woesebacteria bacterium RIFCSPHIGHO2_12_FULL_42_9]
MAKKIVLVIIGIIILGAAFVFFFRREKSSKLVTTLPTINIPDPVGGGFQIETTIKESQFNFPGRVRLLESESLSPLTEEEAKEVAAGFGFEGEPRSASGKIHGTRYYWSNSDYTLTVYGGTRKVGYSLNYPPFEYVNQNLSNESLINLSRDFIVDNSIYNESEITFSYFTFLERFESAAEGLRSTTKEKADINVANFSPIESEFKILTLDPNASPISVWVAPDGTIIKAEIILIDLSFGNEEHQVKNFQEFKGSLNKSVVISLQEGFISIVDLPKADLEKVVVNEVELAYLADTLVGGKFQPVFLLKGTATVKGIGGEVPILLYLPALKS